jgi:hypothetical protein
LKVGANGIAYFTLLAVNAGCFGVGLAGALFAERLMRLRGSRPAGPALEKTAAVLVSAVRILSAVVVILSAYLFWRLFRIYPCVFPPNPV